MSSDTDENERFFKKYQKEAKAERKQKSALDRSKYKKSDQYKHQKKHIKEEEAGSIDGLVVRIVSRGFIVLSGGKEYLSSIKGSLKEVHHEDKNLVTIGDIVRILPKEDDISVITSIAPRKSALMRQDTLVKGKRQIIAANVDQVLICSSLIDPPLKPPLIDRYIIAALKGNLTPIVVINKCDRLLESEQERALFNELKRGYLLAKIPFIGVSAKTNEGLLELEKVLEGKISVFSGQSGVGKSSLINAILDTDLAVGETTKMKKGAHTTTHALLLPLKGNGFCVDTPGVKSFAIWATHEERIDSYFPEMVRYKDQCKFRDCSHTHEEGCRIIKMVEEGGISPLRYQSYLSLLQDEEPKRR